MNNSAIFKSTLQQRLAHWRVINVSIDPEVFAKLKAIVEA
jgi:hypothetical protein